jgi:hypothetical protein
MYAQYDPARNLNLLAFTERETEILKQALAEYSEKLQNGSKDIAVGMITVLDIMKKQYFENLE